MTFWSFDNLRQITAGRWLVRPAGTETDMVLTSGGGVSTDSRSISRGQIFIALRGERFDAHDYLPQVADAGAALLIVDREAPVAAVRDRNVPVLLVADTLEALTRLAAAYRRSLTTHVIAITGSVGKTTTKQLLQAILSAHFRGSASPKSYNNHIGVPLTLLNVHPADRYVIVEVGSNAPGEIASLAKIIEPDVAIITAVGMAHVEKLGGILGVAAEKSALLRYLRPNGLAIVNGDAHALAEFLKPVQSVIRFGRENDCDLRLTDCRTLGRRLRFTINDRASFEMGLLGEHNAVNALAAVAAARHMNLNDRQIADALAQVQPPPMRLNIRTLGLLPSSGGGSAAITLINDAYNANPESMKAALAVLRTHQPDTPCARRVAVLGDMGELGEQSPSLHRQLGRQLAESSIDFAILIGPNMLYAAETLTKVWPPARVHIITSWTDQTPDQVAALLLPNDLVLLKASRYMGLERIVPAIEQRYENNGKNHPPGVKTE
ncbi:MAG: UDP-N-acetylmuramoyl-tripeptide--D-alanyl-D-alanine ligase [Phycisphaerales bacterium]